jgi:hypothetical protein
MRVAILVASVALASMTVAPAMAQVSIAFNTPGLSIGVNIPAYPDFAQVPDYPVYYAPGLASNLFYYDGMYWLFEGDGWYASTWYNGPWERVDAQGVPLFVLRVPVRYYRSPPAYFRGWQADAPPRWDEHWGSAWSQGHRGWDQWNRHDVPSPAPLPKYQGQYSGARYPKPEQQQLIRQQNNKYQPRDEAVRQRLQQPAHTAPAPAPAQARQAPAPQPAKQLPVHQEARQQSQKREQAQKQPQVQQREQQPKEQTQHEQQQMQQPPQQRQSRQEQQQNQVHPAGRVPERPAPATREPAKASKQAPEQSKDRDKGDQGNQGNQENRK